MRGFGQGQPQDPLNVPDEGFGKIPGGRPKVPGLGGRGSAVRIPGMMAAIASERLNLARRMRT